MALPWAVMESSPEFFSDLPEIPEDVKIGEGFTYTAKD
jgi:hypothetical protein